MPKGNAGGTKKSSLSTLLSMSPAEVNVITSVANEYGLDPVQTKLLFTIRQIENGGPGREFGVLNPQAMRFKDNPDLSLLTQAKWAAGTIKRHFTGDLASFADRWAPKGAKNDPNNLNANWLKNAKAYMGSEE